MLEPLESSNSKRRYERLEVAREWLVVFSSAINPTPFAVYSLYEALKAGMTRTYIENYFKGLPEYRKIKRIFEKTMDLAELEFTTSSYYRPSMN